MGNEYALCATRTFGIFCTSTVRVQSQAQTVQPDLTCVIGYDRHLTSKGFRFRPGCGGSLLWGIMLEAAFREPGHHDILPGLANFGIRRGTVPLVSCLKR